MLLAPRAAFYNNVPVVDGILHPSDPFGTLRFFAFPTRPQILHLVVHLYSTGEVRGLLSHRLRRGMDVLERSQPVAVHFPDRGGRAEFDYMYDVRDVVFRREGSYAFDLLLDHTLLCTAPLSVVQIK